MATSRQEHYSWEQLCSCLTPARGCSPTSTHPKFGPRVFRGITGFGGRAGCSVNPTASVMLPNTELSGPFSCTARRGASSKTACAKRGCSQVHSQAAWLLQLACANKHIVVGFFKKISFKKSVFQKFIFSMVFPPNPISSARPEG